MSRTINLKKALVISKQLAGEISKARTELTNNNSRTFDSNGKDYSELHIKYRALVEQLIEVKTQLTLSNTSIYSSIVRVAEIKGLISFYEGLDTTSKSMEYERGSDGTYQHIEKARILNITEEKKISELDLLKKELETLLDAIDTYNYNTTITISF